MLKKFGGKGVLVIAFILIFAVIGIIGKIQGIY